MELNSIHYNEWRLQVALPHELKERLREELEPRWEWFYLDHAASEWLRLRSLPGGKRQGLRTDVRPATELAPLDYIAIPASLLLALQPTLEFNTCGCNCMVADETDEQDHIQDARDVLLLRATPSTLAQCIT